MTGPTGASVAFNGELYNADALREELVQSGRRFIGGSDTEVALAAFELWGDGAFERLDGMFALAIHDLRGDRVLLARDPIGIKPLYYATDGTGRLIFASELRALMSVRRRASHVSAEGLQGFLAFGAPPEPGTIIEGVQMVAPGAALSFSSGGLDVRHLWSLEQCFGETQRESREEAIERLRELLLAAVRRQLVSDVPLGLFLSGGIDSSGLVGLAAAAGVTPHTVSIVFAEKAFSEARWIEAVVSRHRTEHKQIELSGDDFREALPAALDAMDQPTVDGLNTYVVSGVARGAGLTVALSGLGGDELFGGYPLFRSAPRLDRIRGRIPALPGRVAEFAGRIAGGRGDRGRKLARWLGGEAISAHALHRELLDPQTCAKLLRRASPPTAATRPVVCDPVNSLSKLELTTYMRNVLLRDADVMSMAHGLEVRVPLLDLAVVKAVAAMPGELKLDRGREKGLLVDALGDLLPPEVATRPKMGFGLPFAEWLRGPLHAQVAAALTEQSFGGAIAAHLDPAVVAEVWRQFDAGQCSWHRPWALYVAKVWGEAHLGSAW